jgi:hypothetical protein
MQRAGRVRPGLRPVRPGLIAGQRGRRIGVMVSMRAAGFSWNAARQSRRQSRAASSDNVTVPSQGAGGAGHLDVGGCLE